MLIAKQSARQVSYVAALGDPDCSAHPQERYACSDVSDGNTDWHTRLTVVPSNLFVKLFTWEDDIPAGSGCNAAYPMTL